MPRKKSQPATIAPNDINGTPVGDERFTDLVCLGTYTGTDIRVVRAGGQDMYVNVTEMCRALGKEWHRYARLVSAQRFRAALTHKHQNLVYVEPVVIHRVGAKQGERGDVYAHRLIALHLAGWLSVEFELWMYQRIEELMRTGTTSLSPAERDNMVDLMARQRDEVIAERDMAMQVAREREQSLTYHVQLLNNARNELALERQRKDVLLEIQDAFGHVLDVQSTNGMLLATLSKQVTTIQHAVNSDLDAIVVAQRQRIMATPVEEPVAPMSGNSERALVVNSVQRYAARFGNHDYKGAWDRLYAEYLVRYPYYANMITVARETRTSVVEFIEQCQVERTHAVRLPSDVAGARPLTDLRKLCDHLYGPAGTFTREAMAQRQFMSVGSR